MPYDLLLGRIWLPTLQGDYGLTAGDGLEAVGSLVFGGERRPRDLKVTLPIHGEWEDADPRAVADRLRRQLEAFLENEAARLPGVFMRWRPFPDRDAWVVIGGGDFTDAEGGPTFGEYRLELDVRRAATTATHRTGRRLRSIDRRLATTPRDFLGRLFSSDFAALPSLPLHFLPPGASDVLGAGGVLLAPGARKALGGSVGVLANRLSDEVVTFERPPIAIANGGADVVLTDRRGRPDWTPKAAGPRNPSFDGASGEGSVARWPSISASDAPGTASEFRASDVWTARPESRFSAYFKISRATAGTMIVRSETGTAGVPMTPAGKASLRLVYFGLQAFSGAATIRARIYWYKADGSASATATTDVQINTDLALPNLGRIDFGALTDVPADAAFGAVALISVAPAAGGVWEGYLDDVILEDVTGLGLTAPRPYADGESRDRVWLGDAGDSHHSPDRHAAGHEELYGPAQPLKAPIADVPVLENGLARVRYVAAPGGWVTLALDAWDPVALRWLERGRIMPWLDSPIGTRNGVTLQRAAVIEWTPERAVVRVTTVRAGIGRVELYITLQRGWIGPRVEAYAKALDGTAAGAQLQFAPAGVAAAESIVSRTDPVAGTSVVYSAPDSSFANVSVGASSSTNVITVQPKDSGPAVAIALIQAAATLVLRNDTTAYGDVRNGVSVAGGSSGYLSAHFGLIPAGYFEAEAIAAGTGVVVADAAAIGGSAVEDPQAAETASSVSAPGLPVGLYGVWARVRVVNAGATGSFRARSNSVAPTIVTTTSQTYVWLYLGEVTLSTPGGTVNVRGWRSAGTGAVRIDRVLAQAVERRDVGDLAYDGVRDFAQAELADARQDLALVSR